MLLKINHVSILPNMNQTVTQMQQKYLSSPFVRIWGYDFNQLDYFYGVLEFVLAHFQRLGNNLNVASYCNVLLIFLKYSWKKISLSTDKKSISFLRQCQMSHSSLTEGENYWIQVAIFFSIHLTSTTLACVIGPFKF